MVSFGSSVRESKMDAAREEDPAKAKKTLKKKKASSSDSSDDEEEDLSVDGEGPPCCWAAQAFHRPIAGTTCPGWISGHLRFPPGAIKKSEGVGECSQVREGGGPFVPTTRRSP